MTDNRLETFVFRILDAATNRAQEGIRVVEDCLRLAVGDPFLASRLKSLRHQIAAQMMPISPRQRLAARDAEQDVGRDLESAGEYQRSSLEQLVSANLARAQQALRTMEEFSKTLDQDVARGIEQLRYDLYTLEKATLIGLQSALDLASVRLYVLIDAEHDLEQMLTLTSELMASGVRLFQLRDKQMNDRQLVKAGRALGDLLRGTGARWIMNDRADVAAVCDADGVHLGQTDLGVADARQLLGPAKIVGVSTHELAQAEQAVIDGADYIGVGPVFESGTKTFEKYAGLELVSAVAQHIGLPAFAIGGIGLNNIEQVCRAGMLRVAVHSSVTRASQPGSAAAELIAKLLENSTPPRSAPACKNQPGSVAADSVAADRRD